MTALLVALESTVVTTFAYHISFTFYIRIHGCGVINTELLKGKNIPKK